MGEIAEVIDQAGERFRQLAPAGMKYEAEKGFAIQLLNNNTYLAKVAQESPASLLQAITNVAAIGLSLNPAKKQAYLITRNVKVGDNQWKSRVFLEPSYMGLCDIATGTGSVEWVQADCVYSNDQEFTHNGPGERPTHKYDPFASMEKRGDFRGVYCVAKLPSGDYLTTMMSAEDVYSIRGRSESWKKKVQDEAKGKKGYGGPWETDFKEMAKKTVLRNAFKLWPKKDMDRMERAVHLSNENEGFEPIVSSPQLGQYTAEQKEYFDQLITNTDPLGMYVFQQTLDDESVFANLYHSFEKGQKGKYQRIVDDLLKRGFESFMDYVQIFDDACAAEDDMAVKENMADLSNDAIALIKDKLAPASARFIDSIQV